MDPFYQEMADGFEWLEEMEHIRMIRRNATIEKLRCEFLRNPSYVPPLDMKVYLGQGGIAGMITDDDATRSNQEEGGEHETVPMKSYTTTSLQAYTNEIAELLRCPVCWDIAIPPIMQCALGHLICSKCHALLISCPTCRVCLEQIRNTAMEKIAEKIYFPCKYQDYGCRVFCDFSRKLKHECFCCYRRPTHGAGFPSPNAFTYADHPGCAQSAEPEEIAELDYSPHLAGNSDTDEASGSAVILNSVEMLDTAGPSFVGESVNIADTSDSDQDNM